MAYIANQLPEDVFATIQRNAGLLLTEFDPTNWTVNKAHIKGATSGGINFTDTPSYMDFGEDIDNCPKNTMELKEIEDREVKVSGTYVAVRPEEIKDLMGAADISGTTITPRSSLNPSDFKKLWFVCDYGKDNAIALELDNVLNTSGFALQTSDKGKGQFAFEYTAHYSVLAPETVPYKFHFKSDVASAASIGDE